MSQMETTVVNYHSHISTEYFGETRNIGLLTSLVTFTCRGRKQVGVFKCEVKEIVGIIKFYTPNQKT